MKHLVEEVGLFVAQKVLGQAAGDYGTLAVCQKTRGSSEASRC